jgi:hypothetical protein
MILLYLISEQKDTVLVKRPTLRMLVLMTREHGCVRHAEQD